MFQAGGLAWARPITLLIFVSPILAGLVGTVLPAFGYLPAAGGHGFGLGAWRDLVEQPGFFTSLRLTLQTGLVATVLSVVLAFALAAWVHGLPIGKKVGALLAPVLSMPHAALAIGFAFLIAPSGWLVRWISPGLTGWEVPPDLSTVGHPSGWPLVLCLLLKEVPYLMLMILGALNQVRSKEHVVAARVLGYSPAEAYLKLVVPQVYHQVRLPVFAVLAFSLSVVDVALIIGPSHPPTLAVLAVRWFAAPEVARYFPAAAAAVLIALIVVLALALWRIGEQLVAHFGKQWIESGRRGSILARACAPAAALCAVLYCMTVLAMFGLVVWSLATQWRFPDGWPAGWSIAGWVRQSASLATPLLNTLMVAGSATSIALFLTIVCLEYEASRAKHNIRPVSSDKGALQVLYLPLIVPQIAFVFGSQVLLLRLGWDGVMGAVIAAHLVFVLPYLMLSLADPWRAFDQRYTRAALSMGASRMRSFLMIKLPILLRPILIACAIGFSVSVGLYLPTLFAGAGRISTLTTEAVTLSAGADRRVIAVWAVLQAALPLLVFLAASWLPRWIFVNRKAMQL